MSHRVFQLGLALSIGLLISASAWAQQGNLGALEAIGLQPRPADTPSSQGYTLSCQRIGPGEYRIRYVLHQVQATRVAVAGHGTFTQLHIAGMGHTAEAGAPQVPLLHSLLGIGQGATVSVEDASEQYASAELSSPIYPAQPAAQRGQPLTAAPFVPTRGGTPDQPQPVFSVQPGGQLRQVHYATLALQPIQPMEAQQVRVLTQGEWTLRVSQPAPVLAQPAAAFFSTYKRLLINYPDILPNHAQRTAVANAGASMLVVLHSDMLEEFLPYYDWKRRMGHNVQLVFTDPLGPNPTPAQIKQLVENEFDAWQPEYVLLVGDVAYIPAASGNTGSLTDHNYACPAGTDYLADLIIARMSVNTPQELASYVTKLLAYERDWVPGDWYTHSVSIGSNDGIDDQHAIDMDAHFVSNGFSSSVFRDSWGFPLRPTALPAIEAGPSWLFFIGHGWSEGWGNYEFYYDNGDLLSLFNTQKPPVVISIACATADLDYDQGQSFAERWMDLGPDRGAANILAATENCAFFYTDTLGKYAVYRYFDHTAETFGEAMLVGKAEMYAAFPEGPGGTTEATMEQFLLLGDPLQLPFTATPTALVATHSATLLPNAGPHNVWVTDALGSPVPNALVCLSNLDAGFQFVARTDSAGLAVLALSALPDSLVLGLVATARNHLPAYDTARVQAAPTVGIADPAAARVQLYPNPAAQGSVVLTATAPLARIDWADATGRAVLLPAEALSAHATRFGTQGLAPGVYAYLATLANGQQVGGRLVVTAAQ